MYTRILSFFLQRTIIKGFVLAAYTYYIIQRVRKEYKEIYLLKKKELGELIGGDEKMGGFGGFFGIIENIKFWS